MQHPYSTVFVQHSVNRPCGAMIGRCCPIPSALQRPVNQSSPCLHAGDAAAMHHGNPAGRGHTVVCHSTPPRPCTDNRPDSGMLLWTTTGYHRDLIVPAPPAPAGSVHVVCVLLDVQTSNIAFTPPPPLPPPPTQSYAPPAHTHGPLGLYISPVVSPPSLSFFLFLLISYNHISPPVQQLASLCYFSPISAVLFSHSMREYHGFSYP